jgi:hemolysin III
VEPWSTWTNLVFLFVIVYWARRLRGQWRRQFLLSLSLPLLTIGWVGGTLYHATRSHDIWLMLDWCPIVMLILLAAYWLWRRLLPGSILAAATALLLPVILAAGMARLLVYAGRSGISASYAILAAGVVVPAVLNCVRQRHAWPWLAGVIVCFVAALTFRILDEPLADAGWPHGSHYLWHLFGGFATFLMFAFLYRLREGDQPATS